MWDWYTRPGGIRRVPTWKIAVVIAGLAVATTILFVLLYAVLFPLIFSKIG